jgi:hypothetical protein
MGMAGHHHTPLINTWVRDPVPTAQKAGWASGPVCMGAENLAPPGFDLWTVQPIASHYNNYAIPAHMYHYCNAWNNFIMLLHYKLSSYI